MSEEIKNTEEVTPVVDSQPEDNNTIPYDRFKQVNDKYKSAKEELEGLQSQIASYEEKLKDVVSKDDFELFKSEKETEYTQKLNQTKITSALENQLIKQGAKDEYSSMIATQIDTSNLKIDDKGNVVDNNGITIDVIISNKKEQFPDLFGTKVVSKGTATNPEQGKIPDVDEKEAMLDKMRALAGLK